MADVLIDALLDTLKLLPFLLLSYILIELLEHKTKLSAVQRALRGRGAPLLGAVTGVLPQCGFSVMAAKLYDRRYLTVGTLLAVFLATSDEAFILFLVNGRWLDLAVMLLSKIVIGAGVGMIADVFVRRKETARPPEDKPAEQADPSIGEPLEGCEACGTKHKRCTPFFVYFLSPLAHSLKVAFFILLVNFGFGVLFYYLGEEAVVEFLQKGVWIQPLIAPLVGLIPNCASSVVLTQTYLAGGIAFGSLLGGLCANAGIGLFELAKNVKAIKRTLAVVAVLYLTGVAVGYLANAVALAFA